MLVACLSGLVAVCVGATLVAYNFGYRRGVLDGYRLHNRPYAKELRDAAEIVAAEVDPNETAEHVTDANRLAGVLMVAHMPFVMSGVAPLQTITVYLNRRHAVAFSFNEDGRLSGVAVRELER